MKEAIHVRSVIAFAKTHLSAVRRGDGATYFQHGMKIADALRQISDDHTIISAALCHDLLVLPSGRQLLQASPLSEEEQRLALGMHELRKLHIDENTRDLDRVIRSFGKDSRLLVLRMAHRLIDIRNLPAFPAERQRQIARETLHMYTSIAGRLGFHQWRYEMEDACFRVLQPQKAAMLEAAFAKRSAVDAVCIERTTEFLREKLQEEGIAADLGHRIKGLYSTYRKMVLKRRAFDELTDRIAIRILVPTLSDCYRALGVVHHWMHPIPGKLKDYIGTPKENGYRSIHTVVWPLPGITEQALEVQIRTEEMNRECELGIASHSEYKRLSYTLQSSGTTVDLWRNLQTLRAEVKSPEQFEKALRSYFDDAHIAIFDADGNLHHMPYPITARAFLKSIQWNGNTTEVRINGRKRPASTELKDGDCVEGVR